MSADTSYDEVPYPGKAYAQTHPTRLAVLATLWGLTPPPVATCRVLELGCGDGGNLIPMAARLPEATFLGLDLSRREIEDGQARVKRLGLSNLVLRAQDLLEAWSDLGQFDYVIAHGLYSWVPPAVQERVLAICGGHLAPGGVAYVSYNALPGGRMRQMLRDMMLFDTRALAVPHERVARARALVDFLADVTKETEDPYACFLRQERDTLASREDAPLLHDDLGAFNEALYFHEFIARAGRHGLQFLGEATFADSHAEALAPAARERLESMDRLAFEQWLDFVKGQTFRRTLLCRAEERVMHPATPERWRGLHVRAAAFPVVSESEAAAPHELSTRSGEPFSLDRPLVSAALAHLASVYPDTAPVHELPAAARARLKEPVAEGDEAEIGGALLWLYANELVEAYAHAPAFAHALGDRPKAPALTRDELTFGNRVTDPWHGTVEIGDALPREILRRLDGTNDYPTLVRGLVEWSEGRMTVEQIAAHVSRAVPRLAEMGLLE